MKLRIFLFLGATLGLYFFLFGPLIALMQAHPLRFQADTPPTLRKHLLAKLTLLEHAKRSPILAYRATQSQRALLRLWLSPSKLHREQRAFLQKGSLSTWHVHEQQWRDLIDTVQTLLPNERLRYLHAFLDLQSGAWERLIREASRHIKEIPTDIRDALFWFWVGHAAFFAGNTQAAHTAYQKALRTTQDHPEWSTQTRHNWRIPGEILVARYHLALLYLPQQAHHALPLLQQNLHHWKKIYKQPERSPLWYHSLLWLAITQIALQDTAAATQSLHQALRFSSDTSLARWLLARISPPHQAQLHLNAILQSPPHFPYAPPDIQAAARLLRGLLLPNNTPQPTNTNPRNTATSQPTNTNPHPIATSQPATSQMTHFPPCVPISTDALTDLDHALTILQRPQSPSSLAHLHQRGDYSFAFSVLPSDLLQRWIQRLCTHLPAHKPRRAALRLLLSLQTIREGRFAHATQQLQHPTLSQHLPHLQRTLHTILQRELAPLPLQSSPTSPKMLRLRAWFYALGFDGCLAIDPRNTKAQARCKTIRPFLLGHPVPMRIFASPLISHAPDRFSLLTLRLKETLRQHWNPTSPAPPRLQAIQRLYRELPHAHYLLDQTTYSLAWGTLAFSFHPPR